jgi:hypothetical protein
MLQPQGTLLVPGSTGGRLVNIVVVVALTTMLIIGHFFIKMAHESLRLGGLIYHCMNDAIEKEI